MMIDPVFSRDIEIGYFTAPEYITEVFSHKPYFRASLLQENGITAETFMHFAGRFALICDSGYGGRSSIGLVVDRETPKIKIDSPELHEALDRQPCDELITPTEPVIFAQVFQSAETVEITIQPAIEIPEMPLTIAQVSWKRKEANLMNFYAQSGSSLEGRASLDELYAKMFYVESSAPCEDIDVALGITAVNELRRLAVGNDQFLGVSLERFNATRRRLCLPEQSTTQAGRITGKTLRRAIRGIFRSL